MVGDHFENKTAFTFLTCISLHKTQELTNQILFFEVSKKKTWGIGSLAGSKVVGFSEEPKLERPVALCLVIRGEPQLLGESGGAALPAGNIDGIALLVAELEPDATFKVDPANASWSNVAI